MKLVKKQKETNEKMKQHDKHENLLISEALSSPKSLSIEK